MGSFLRTQALTIILAVYGLFYTEVPYYLLCTAGLLLFVFTLENISYEINNFIIIIKVVLCTMLCILSDGFLIFLLFGQAGYKRTSFILPPVIYAVVQAVCNINCFFDIFPVLLVKIIVVIVLSVAIWYVQRAMEAYTDYKDKIILSMQKLALSGFTEKKLNHALIMQNNIIERNARLEERENISRNIHNSVGHTITAASMALDAAGMLWETDPGRAADKAKIANERIQMGLESVRHAVRVLDEESENIHIDDFKMEIEAIIDNFIMDTEIKVYFDMEIIEPGLWIPHEHTEFLTGAIEELLVNGVKHGMADQFTIWLSADSAHLKISVADNGKSNFNSENAMQRIQNGFGIKKIIKYAEKAGGSTEFRNNNGFFAEVMIPLE